jgi:hypothetical protein
MKTGKSIETSHTVVPFMKAVIGFTGIPPQRRRNGGTSADDLG